MNDYKELIDNLSAAILADFLRGRMPQAELFAKAADAIEQLVKERDAAKADGWINTKEKLPSDENGDWVLAQVVEDNGYMWIPCVMEYRKVIDDWFGESTGWLKPHNGVFKVTHWMPLPASPRNGEV